MLSGRPHPAPLPACACPTPENTLLITGYQSEGTMGRALLDGARFVRIHKGEVPVLAEVASLKGLSGHADAERDAALAVGR